MNSNNRFVQIIDEPIDQRLLENKITDPDVGAHAWFHGVTRKTTVAEGKTKVTERLSYEAHRAMAVAELESIADRAVDRFGLQRIVIVHRLGDVPVGQASVVVGCSSPHRQSVFDALPWVMNVLKQDVPIWKCERYDDGTTEWVHPIESGDA